MKRTIVTALLILICFLLQSSVFDAISFGGIIPNILIILTASFGFMNGENTGMLIGFFCGLLLDIYCGVTNSYGTVLGFYALLYTLAGYVNGRNHRLFYPDDIKFPLFMVLITDIAYNLVCYVGLFLFRNRLDLSYYLLHIILPEAVYTIIITFFVYPVFLKLNKLMSKWDSRSSK